MYRVYFFVQLLFITTVVIAQENYEIQVYSSQTQTKHTTIIELHSNFTFSGEKNIVQGVLPSYHSLHETVEITHGISDIFEMGFYLFTNYTPQHNFSIVGSHIRPRIMAPAKWNLPVGLSLSAELGYQKKEYAAETWSLEIRPIIDKQWNKVYASFNPTFGIALKSMYENRVPVFEPNLKFSYGCLKNWSFGAEYYGGLGAINNFEKFSKQDHALFLTADLLNDPIWELNTGAGFGLTKATDGFVLKIIIGRRIFWKKNAKPNEQSSIRSSL